MLRKLLFATLLTALALATTTTAQTPRKIILDQDARGPATTDQISMLLALNSPQAEVLGITVVSGDYWRDEEVAHTLRMLELTHHTNIKVYPGAVFPLINSKEEIARWEKIYGKVRYQGAWTKNGTGKFIPEVHGPYEVPNLPEGNPTLKPETEDAAHFIIRMVHQYPHEVTIYAGGPLTNIAQVVSLDPHVPELAEELVIMGGSIAPISTSAADGADNRREFNFWWDPEAVHMVMRAPWKKVTLTTVDISIKTRMTQQMIDEIGKSTTPTAKYIKEYADSEFLWDELAVCAWLDPSLITRTTKIYVDMDISHTAGYGNTLTWREGDQPGLGENLVNVQEDLNLDKFYSQLIHLLSTGPQ